MYFPVTGNAGRVFSGLLLSLLLVFGGCAIGPSPRETVASYDLGPQNVPAPASPASRLTLMVQEAVAPSWLDTTGIVYRLAYLESSRPQVYAQSRWVDAPSALLSQRMRTRFAAVGPVVNGRDGARADYAVQVEIEDFSQIFDAADSGRVSIRLRVSLVNLSSRALHAQRTFSASQPSEPDAKGAVRAFSRATDGLLEDILEWTRASLKAA